MKLAPFARGLGGLVLARIALWAFFRFGLDAWLLHALMPSSATVAQEIAFRQLHGTFLTVFQVGMSTTLGVAMFALPVGFLVRMLLRARARAGLRDPFAGARATTKERPGLVNLLLAVPPLLGVALVSAFAMSRSSLWFHQDTSWNALMLGVAAPGAAVLALQHWLLRRGWRALVSPSLEEGELGDSARTAEGFEFDAVAVTRETRAMVGGLAGLSFAMVAASYWLNVGVLMRSPLFLAALVAYLAVAVGLTAFFVRASRIRVGLDGVHVSGSSRERFVPFSEVDDARLDGVNLDLVRGERRVLRLQLHGEDALRSEALAERLRGAIVLARQQRDEPAVAFVKGADVARIERAASGAGNYREVAPTREKLWEMLESPAVDAKGRAAAAEALSKSTDDDERARLRRIATECAEPTVRARIAELLDTGPAADEEEAPSASVRLMRLVR